MIDDLDRCNETIDVIVGDKAGDSGNEARVVVADTDDDVKDVEAADPSNNKDHDGEDT